MHPHKKSFVIQSFNKGVHALLREHDAPCRAVSRGGKISIAPDGDKSEWLASIAEFTHVVVEHRFAGILIGEYTFDVWERGITPFYYTDCVSRTFLWVEGRHPVTGEYTFKEESYAI